MNEELEYFKIDFSQARTRKDVLDLLGDKAKALPMFAAAVAWEDLAKSLEGLADPARPRPPRFRDLVTVCYASYLKGASEWLKAGKPGLLIDLAKEPESSIEAGSCRQQSTATEITHRF